MKRWHESFDGVWGWMAAVLLLPGLALAGIGKVSVLEGTATRAGKEGAPQALKVGSEIEVHDTLQVGPSSHVKLTLNDGSVIMLGADSQLVIDEASFEGQERRGFIARLGFGKIWSRVKKALAGSDAKFEVTTERAVAGVRGTIFQVEYGGTVKAATPAAQKPRMLVRVVEGRVVVDLHSKTAKSPAPASDSKKGGRTQVAGPQQVSLKEWNQKFIELQAQQEVEVGEELGAARPLDTAAMDDAFGRFVKRNQ